MTLYYIPSYLFFTPENSFENFASTTASIVSTQHTLTHSLLIPSSPTTLSVVLEVSYLHGLNVQFRKKLMEIKEHDKSFTHNKGTASGYILETLCSK